MEEFNFEQLKNIEVPQRCIEKALKIPAESKKSASPVRLYRFAAGIAACVVIAAAVTLSLMTGINKDVDMTAPDPENPSRSELVCNETGPSSTGDISSPSKTPPLLFGADSQSSTAVTEPAESSANGSGANGTKNSKQKSASTSNGNNKAQAPTKSKSNNGSTPQKPDEPAKRIIQAQGRDRPLRIKPSPKPVFIHSLALMIRQHRQALRPQNQNVILRR